MVAGIFEKSKRLRKAFFLDIRRLPISQAQKCRAPNCGMWRETRAGITVKTKEPKRHVSARRDKTPRRRRLWRMAKKVELYRSAPVCKACSVSPACETAAVPIRGEPG